MKLPLIPLEDINESRQTFMMIEEEYISVKKTVGAGQPVLHLP